MEEIIIKHRVLKSKSNGSKIKKMKEVEPEIKERHDPWRNQNG